jgi:hypothetical protein
MECMGRSLSGCVWYEVQEGGGANDGEEWSCIDEGKWKERRQIEREGKKVLVFAWCVVGSKVVPNVVDGVRDA